MRYVKVLGVPFLIIVVSIFLDLITKAIVDSNMRLYQTIVVIPNWLEIYYITNDGAAFSMLEGKIGLFIAITIPALIAMVFCLIYFKDRSTVLNVSLALIIGGTIGNFYDRIKFGAVRDFVQIIYGGHDLGILGTSFAIFNVADSCLTIGLVLLAYYFIFLYVDPKDAKAVDKHNRKQAEKLKCKNLRIAKTVESVEDFLNREELEQES